MAGTSRVCLIGSALTSSITRCRRSCGFGTRLFAFVLGPSNFFAWALSVMFLVFTLRAILYKPFVRQIRTTRQMQELQPQIKALQKKYGKDRQRMALEMQKLQKEHGFNPILGCLPMLAQIPVFLGLYHVLRSFNRTQTGFGSLRLSVEENSIAGQLRVQRGGRRPLPGCQPVRRSAGRDHDPDAGPGGVHRIPAARRSSRVGVPMMIAGGHRHLLQQPRIGGAAEPRGGGQPADRDDEQARAVRVPARRRRRRPVPAAGDHHVLGVNNIWTFGQQHYVFGKIEKEEEAKKVEALERRAANAPAPGAKPRPEEEGARPSGRRGDRGRRRSPRRRTCRGAPSRRTADGEDRQLGSPTRRTPPNLQRRNGAVNRTPKPGARPKKRKR